MSNEASEAARALGAIKTARKAAAVRENGKLGGRPAKPLNEIPCTCGAGDGVALEGHKFSCKRRLTAYGRERHARRKAEGKMI